MRAAVVNEKTLAEVALQIHLSSLVRLGKGESRTGGAKKHSIVSSTLEAMIAAVYLDGGFLEAYQVVQRLFKSFLNEHMSSKTSLDYKTSLQELIQAQYKMTPTYHLLGTDGPDHERLFSVEVRMGQTILAQAQGSSKKEAEQNAAKIAIDQTTSTGIALGSV
jgi:dsRNA-specific ribonuclease